MYTDGNNHDRLIVCLFAAAVFHAVLILGLGFELPKPPPIDKSLDIVLVQTPSVQAPEQADFLAPANQQGSGGGKKKATPKATPLSQQGSGEEPVPPKIEPKPTPLAKPQPKLTQEKSEKNIQADVGEDDPIQTEEPPHLTAEALSQQIAETSIEWNNSQESQAKEPKVVDINSVSAHRDKAAAYKLGWQQKVERVGNLNYPDEARRKKLSGSLTLAVGIKQDGSVYSIKVQESSGEPVLDDAAKRIVNLAAPYAVFPEELKQDADVLVITRTWCFTAGKGVETCR